MEGEEALEETWAAEFGEEEDVAWVEGEEGEEGEGAPLPNFASAGGLVRPWNTAADFKTRRWYGSVPTSCPNRAVRPPFIVLDQKFAGLGLNALPLHQWVRHKTRLGHNQTLGKIVRTDGRTLALDVLVRRLVPVPASSSSSSSGGGGGGDNEYKNKRVAYRRDKILFLSLRTGNAS
jgi:hypothetical protein